jgi:outer membrane protein OmpA-like peptidoglycan-associated protein
MMKHLFFLVVFLLCRCFHAQIIIVGHNQADNAPILNTKIIVNDGSANVQTFDTKKSADFTLKLNFGKIYRVYFQNAQCAQMFMEVLANNIPEDKKGYKMTYEMSIPLVFKNDDSIDTLQFSKPFHKIIFDGKNKMIDDTTYNNNFSRNIFKKEVIDVSVNGKEQEMPSTIAGKILLNNNPKITITNKQVSLLNKNGEVIKTTKTNRFGQFAMAGILASQVSKIKLETKEPDAAAQLFSLVNTKSKTINSAKPTTGNCIYSLKTEEVLALVDNNYNTNIGGKLILTSAGRKKFMAGKTVYLSNKRNTIVKKTTTNSLGTFVFENLKPDNTYFIGMDAKEALGGEQIELLNKDDKFVNTLDTIAGGRRSFKIVSDYNEKFNDISIDDLEMKMSVKAKLYGDNVNNPIGKLKILLLNDTYQVIDSAYTDDFGAFKFKYLPFIKRFYFSAENTDGILDVFNNILVYSSDDNMIKIMTHQKGAKFNYKPIDSEMSRLRDVEVDDPWLDFMGKSNKNNSLNKTIIETILFETNKFELLPQAKEILNKVVLVLNTNKQLKIELSAHTDSKGNDGDNLKLSQLRAKSATDYVSENGIERDRIISVGYGETKIINKCLNTVNCSELEHAQNRRVEFKILEQ